LVPVDGSERPERILLGTGGGHTVLDNAEHRESGKEREHHHAAHHGPIIGLSRSSLGRTACYL